MMSIATLIRIYPQPVRNVTYESTQYNAIAIAIASKTGDVTDVEVPNLTR
jgi:hypothetical protein